MSTPPTLSCGVWPIYLYLLRRLSTRQCSHLLPSAVTAGAVAAERTCSWYAAPAIDRYLLPAGRLAAKPLAVAAVDQWDIQTGETDRHRHTTRQRQELFRKKVSQFFPRVCSKRRQCLGARLPPLSLQWPRPRSQGTILASTLVFGICL